MNYLLLCLTQRNQSNVTRLFSIKTLDENCKQKYYLGVTRLFSIKTFYANCSKARFGPKNRCLFFVNLYFTIFIKYRCQPAGVPCKLRLRNISLHLEISGVSNCTQNSHGLNALGKQVNQPPTNMYNQNLPHYVSLIHFA